MVLTVGHDGTVRCLYGELIDLRVLGTLSCERASHIEFDEGSQQWQVLSPDRQTMLFHHPSRAICEAWEHDHLQPE